MNVWIVIVVTLFLSALCSGLEIAFNSINRLQLEVELTKNTFSASLIRIFLKDQSRLDHHRHLINSARRRVHPENPVSHQPQRHPVVFRLPHLRRLLSALSINPCLYWHL